MAVNVASLKRRPEETLFYRSITLDEHVRTKVILSRIENMVTFNQNHNETVTLSENK